MIKVKTVINGFFAGYGSVSWGTIIEMEPQIAKKAVAIGFVTFVRAIDKTLSKKRHHSN